MSGRIARPGGQLIARADANPMAMPGIVELYRTVLGEASAFARRRHLEILTEVVLVGAYFLLRTFGDDLALGLWLVVAVLVAVVAPTSGLVVLAVIAPFNEGITVTRD
ncbi:MAG TPA: hypothetical protein VE640_08445, partial [Candidatus Bathyarchaeia archaeon]|nr:hypothetical protein [Candidatus Bathyarchaeia archaeon]